MRELETAEHRFIEAMGLYFERRGGTRIGGRIYALLMLAGEPLSNKRIAELLKVSAASVSTNLRACADMGLVEPASVPGDRQHYHVIHSQGWEGKLRVAEESLSAFARICAEALAVPRLAGNRSLREASAFCDFYKAELTGIAERWRAAHAPRPPRPDKTSKGRTA
ncbi:ArsR family transcriptional regulator [Myxococcus sp. AM001]|uniref:GbsR/MarR family transcriptional regulator n=1 Tax=Myxococcus vastator TaxID=2709664 RepID=UPI0013D7B948|nr:MarR family transcriptional regulator [Myxococcus vastator]NVJ05077.1 ArsR family transcriptional regulator [Myxococcus sp. AM001]